MTKYFSGCPDQTPALLSGKWRLLWSVCLPQPGKGRYHLDARYLHRSGNFLSIIVTLLCDTCRPSQSEYQPSSPSRPPSVSTTTALSGIPAGSTSMWLATWTSIGKPPFPRPHKQFGEYMYFSIGSQLMNSIVRLNLKALVSQTNRYCNGFECDIFLAWQNTTLCFQYLNAMHIN